MYDFTNKKKSSKCVEWKWFVTCNISGTHLYILTCYCIFSVTFCLPEFIVTFNGYYKSSARGRYIAAALNNSNSVLQWEILERKNPAADFPSDFDVVLLEEAVEGKKLNIIIYIAGFKASTISLVSFCQVPITSPIVDHFTYLRMTVHGYRREMINYSYRDSAKSPYWKLSVLRQLSMRWCWS